MTFHKSAKTLADAAIEYASSDQIACLDSVAEIAYEYVREDDGPIYHGIALEWLDAIAGDSDLWDAVEEYIADYPRPSSMLDSIHRFTGIARQITAEQHIDRAISFAKEHGPYALDPEIVDYIDYGEDRISARQDVRYSSPWVQRAKVPLGTLSHGTMRAEDLEPKFWDLLRTLNPLEAEDLELDLVDLDDQDMRVFELFDAIDACLPHYLYFGAHPGDGSDFGIWIAER